MQASPRAAAASRRPSERSDPGDASPRADDAERSVSATEAYFASRSMQALEVLAFGPATATQVADELQVHARTARRLLSRMAADGWLTRRDGPRPTYTPTLRIVALAAQLAHRTPLVRHGVALAGALELRSGETVHLAVPSYRSALRLVRVTAACGRVSEVRDLEPAGATAAGKLLLAFRDPWREVVLASPLHAVTERTLVDPGALRDELENAREHGYATEDEELRPGVRAIAVPVRGHGGEVVAALALSSAQTSLPDLLDHGDPVRAAAAELSARLSTESA
jgi:DNA-binding IclR family transcriptional regulator